MPESEPMKWEPTMFRSGDYVVYRNSPGEWQALFKLEPVATDEKTAELAFAACERHKESQHAV